MSDLAITLRIYTGPDGDLKLEHEETVPALEFTTIDRMSKSMTLMGMRHVIEFEFDPPVAPTQGYTVPGDELQSAAGRLAVFVRFIQKERLMVVPYEIALAAEEAESAVEGWTAVRRSTPPPESASGPSG